MKPAKLLFGTAGTPKSSKKRNSISGIERVHELGLGCMELEFVRGVKMGEGTAKEVHDMSEKEDISLSVHAPYYINLNSAEPEKVDASIERIYTSARIGSLCGARNIVFHLAYYHKDAPENVYESVYELLKLLSSRLEDEGIDVILRPETTGKATQFGSLKENVRLGCEIDNVLPCIDFAHLHARSNGAENSYEEFASTLGMIENELGREGLDEMHMHVSGIEYSEKGERNHLNLDDSDLEYAELMRALKDFKVKGLLICESPDNEGDALLLQKTYESI
ncbi:TIM barrel protein [Methanolobus mangrovi]|uniref:TIM barrel protein n=1 Tax=Methanolobus mangrovi TaxID=3072977 RepID=A0AA51YIV3_9EURY|nr:TIM barrel protein [Methanolobus mangrovi]WMW21933.1 TIM barrel protein [Methanolobus mangrovi]